MNIIYSIQLERGSRRHVEVAETKVTLWYAKKVVNKRFSLLYHWQRSVQKTTLMFLLTWDRKPAQSSPNKLW